MVVIVSLDVTAALVAMYMFEIMKSLRRISDQWHIQSLPYPISSGYSQ
ncbi:MAG: hypothetical protein WAM27_07270 [Nitrososphaeraceae archaeon]